MAERAIVLASNVDDKSSIGVEPQTGKSAGPSRTNQSFPEPGIGTRNRQGRSPTADMEPAALPTVERPVVDSRPTIPAGEYLNETVVPILLGALIVLSEKRPEKPIDFLIEYLTKEKDHFQR